MISSAEVVSPQLKKDPTKFLDFTAQEHDKLRQFSLKVKSVPVNLDERELDSVIRKFEETVHHEKARVDSNLLNLTSIFTRMVHETRNKVFKHLDAQANIFKDNVQFLKERLAGFKQQTPNIPDFDKTEMSQRVSHAPETKRSDLIEEKLNEIYKTKRVYEANQREKEQYTVWVDKVRSAAQVLQQRNDESYTELSKRFEIALQNIVEEYHPRGLKSFRQKKGACTHLEVDYYNYFKSGVAPAIHYFEPETKNLHFFALPGADKKDKAVSRKVVLDNEFVVPAYHGSIVTPEGKIFMMGGIDVFGDNTSNCRCYEYDEKTASLYRKSNMIAERYGFAITYSKGKIYVFGGINRNGVLNSCEAYDIVSNKWSSLPNMSTASVHASVCNFKDRYIYKFGGFRDNQAQNRSIERFSLLDKTWSSVNVQYDLIFPLCASAQINAHEVIVFGGLKEDKTGSNRSFVLSVDANYDESNRKGIYEAVTSLGQADLPQGDGFWNPQTIVHDNSLYVLQNVSAQGNVTGRRLLEFTEGHWKVLN